MSTEIKIEVAYALPHEQTVLQLTVPEGTTVGQAVELSGIARRYPEINLATSKVGVYGKAAKADTVLHDFDRVEIYRPLVADPKTVRKKRAADDKGEAEAA